MNELLKRYWFEFDIDYVFAHSPGIGIGCGVTAIDYNDAIEIMSREIFRGQEMPTIKTTIENVNINDLDQGHVFPNMKNPTIDRGVWFPLI